MNKMIKMLAIVGLLVSSALYAPIINDDVATKVFFKVDNRSGQNVKIIFNKDDIKDSCGLGLEGVAANKSQTIGANIAPYQFALCEVDNPVVFTTTGANPKTATYATDSATRRYNVVIEKDGDGIKVVDAAK